MSHCVTVLSDMAVGVAVFDQDLLHCDVWFAFVNKRDLRVWVLGSGFSVLGSGSWVLG